MSRIVRHRFLPHVPTKKPPPTARCLSSETLASADPPNPTPKPTPTPKPAGKSRLRTAIKVSASAGVAAAIGAVGYASYAYDLEELDKAVGGLRPMANYSAGDDASSFEKFQATVYSTACKGDSSILSDMDLSKLNRDPSRVIYVSGHALEGSLQPENSLPIKPWKLENDDTALLDLIPFLEYVAVHRPADIRTVLASYQGRDIASEFIERSREHQRRMQEQKQQGGFWRRRTSQ